MSFFHRPQRSQPDPTPESFAHSTLHGPDRDPASRLPAEARDKVHEMRREVADAIALVKVPYERMKDLRDDMTKIESRIDELERDRGGSSTNNASLIAAERANFERFKIEYDRVSAEWSDRKAISRAEGALLARVEEFLRNLRTEPQLAPALPAPKIAKNETVADAVDRVRATIVNLKHEIEFVRTAPIHSDEAKRLAREQLSILAANGRPDVEAIVSAGSAIEWPMTTPSSLLVNGGAGGVATLDPAIDVTGLFFWLNRDALIERVEDLIDEESDDENALDDVERARRIAALRREILGHERSEEQFIVAAREQGQRIERRADCDVRAVLGVADSARA